MPACRARSSTSSLRRAPRRKPRADRTARAALALVFSAGLVALTSPRALAAEATRDVVVRGRTQTLRVFGDPKGVPVVVSSGDGGWIHVAPLVTKVLVDSGHYVVGVDCKAYLSSFTDGQKTLTTSDVPEDYRVFVDAARDGRDRRVFLAGASEGAGLSVLAASGATLKPSLEGVIGLGLPELNELGWRFRDQMIYLTHRVPKEPLFHSSEFVPLLAPVPLALIQSTHDDFVPPEVTQLLMTLPGGPKRLWSIDAKSHSFGGSEDEFRKAVGEALAWLSEQRGAAARQP